MTRIAFLTSGLEPGKDGVGDYTRDLAAECERLGHATTLLALSDRHVGQPRLETQPCRGAAVSAMRLPALTDRRDRLSAARERLDEFGPEWLSVQFVAYGFNPRGIVSGLGEHLRPLTTNRRVHVMLHELWLGESRGAPIRHRLVGALQRRAILAFLTAIAPSAVHTSNEAFRRMLRARGVDSQILPLCGSIPIATAFDREWLARQLRLAGVSQEHTSPRERCWWFGMFGALHPEWPPEPLFGMIRKAAREAGRSVAFASIGRMGPGNAVWAQLAQAYAPEFGFARLGERPAAEVSAFLQSVDFGIATTPWVLIGKSASASAMLEHGLPTIVNRDEVRFTEGASDTEADPLLYRMSDDMPAWLRQHRLKAQPRSRLGQSAERFLRDLGSATDGRYRPNDVAESEPAQISSRQSLQGSSPSRRRSAACEPNLIAGSVSSDDGHAGG